MRCCCVLACVWLAIHGLCVADLAHLWLDSSHRAAPEGLAVLVEQQPPPVPASASTRELQRVQLASHRRSPCLLLAFVHLVPHRLACPLLLAPFRFPQVPDRRGGRVSSGVSALSWWPLLLPAPARRMCVSGLLLATPAYFQGTCASRPAARGGPAACNAAMGCDKGGVLPVAPRLSGLRRGSQPRLSRSRTLPDSESSESGRVRPVAPNQGALGSGELRHIQQNEACKRRRDGTRGTSSL